MYCRQLLAPVLLILLALASPFAFAQTQTPAMLPKTGIPPFGSFGGGPLDTLNLGDLNDHIVAHVFSRAGRGVPFSYDLSYDTSVWYPVGSSGNQTWTPVQNWGLVGQTQVATGEIIAEHYPYDCYTYIPLNHRWVLTGHRDSYYWDYYVDPWGVVHPFGNGSSSQSAWGSCNGSQFPQWNANTTTTDGSGYTLVTVNYSSNPNLTARDGTAINAPVNVGTGTGTYTDRNGNQITVSASGVFTDTLGTQALAISGSGTSTSPMVFTYSAPGPSGTGVNAAATINYTNYTVATNFGISTIHEYGATAISLPASIVLADGSQYSFTYEATPSTPSAGACTPLSGTYQTNCVTARLASITLPTGGTINYTYTGGNNGIFADGSTSGLNITTPDTPSGTKWIYTRALGTGAASTTTVTDPQGNNTVIQFQGIYETQKQTYQLISGTQTLLQTINTCYNGAASPCTGTAITLPITRRTQLVAYPDTTGKVCKHDQFFDSYGLQTEQDDYDYGTGAPASSPMRKQITVYNHSLTNGIVSMPSSVTICNGSGTSTACTGPSGSSTGTVVAQTTYCYDEATPSGSTTCGAAGSPTATSGTPQHISITGSRGNATTTNRLVSGSTYLATKTTYFDTGNPQTVTDVNSSAATLNYLDATSTCGNTFPTSVTEPLSLSRSMTWNCVGGVQLTAVDENGKTTTTAYTDPFFWRPSSNTDATGAVTNLSYATSSPYNWSESTMTLISGNSVVDTLTTVDGLGRTHVQQTRQGPSSTNFDTIETDYDTLGRISRVTLPYTGTSGQTNSSAPATTTTYDSLSRPLTVTDAGTGSVAYTYTKNDMYITVGPAPAGETTKRRQLEYNAIGQLTSVCEVTSGSPSGACGQSNAATGYLTNYVNDVLGNLTGVTQNAQPNGTAQTRSYIFDGLSRKTSETNPESGTTAYTFDSVTSGNCAATSNGDLIKIVDAVGNSTCNGYDALHRVTSAIYYGPYAANQQGNRYFVYDTATVNGQTMQNGKSRLVEAFTAGCPTCSKITDAGFSYTARGEVSDVYQSTPHSGGYYHLTQTYWAHGAPSQLSNLVGLPTISYGGTIGSTIGLDGEGRITQVTSGTGQNPVTGVSYNNASLPTQVNFGSGDSDIFAYDSSTIRMTQFKFNVGTQSKYLNGALTWNPNGSLGQLAVTDQFNSANTQTCVYSHDDLTRIATANCAAAANQTFSYDPFGNISKSGSPYTFQPTYNAATNRFATIPGATPSYDANGNVLGDGSHNYTWDVPGNSVTIDTVGLTFDALDRMVEQSRGTSYTEIVYAPTGDKLALMNGQTLQTAFVPLLGQATAIYASTGLDHYRHSDWLGSARLTSSPARAYVSSVAYAPYGETYSSSGASDPSFTGPNPDTVSNDYDFFIREYSTEGRWASPDPAGLDAVDPTNPQSWNRYAYVLGNPLALIDPVGLVYGPCGPFDMLCGPPDLGGLSSGGGLGTWGFSWPCFGFLSTGPGGANCPPLPSPPPPQRVNPLKEPCVMTNSFADHQNRTPPSTLPGVDLRTAKGNGTSVFSPVDGTIGRTRSNGTPGGRENFVSVQEQSTGLLVYLVHVSPLANLPTSVTAGQQVGVTDNSGKQTAPHLHLAVRDKQGNLVDPVGAGFVPNCKVK